MDYLDFIARVVSHIPDKGQVTVRHYGLCANVDRHIIRARGWKTKVRVPGKIDSSTKDRGKYK